MSSPTGPRREQPSTYFVQDRSSEDELSRVTLQDHMVTASMGGVLPEQPDPTAFRRVIDIGCGTGGWLIETAKTYPMISRLVGVDISARMIEYARAQAEIQQVSDRVEFHVMDALRVLEFPDSTFDLVNQRLGLSYLRTWDWPRLLQEFQRIAQSGGVIRLSEVDMVESNSPSLTRREEILLQAFYQAGHFFTLSKDGVTRELMPLLRRYGLQNVQGQLHTMEYRAGTVEGQLFAENMARGFRTLQPFMRKWGHLPDDHEAIYQSMLNEMQQPDFVATWKMLTVWGHNR